MKTISFPSGERVGALGLGTWNIGDDPTKASSEIATIQRALDLGVSVIDTAEMYGEGRSERLIGKALKGRREQAFLVSKVLPNHAGRHDMQAACEASLRRLQTDRIDLYLLHWRSSVPLAEVVRGLLALRDAGKIRYFGISNFDLSDMQALWRIRDARDVATNQVLYNLMRRGIEWDLLPWCRSQNMPVMAYSPIEQGHLLKDSRLAGFCRRHGLLPAQASLAWLLAQDNVLAIPKTSDPKRLEENIRAADIRLTLEQLTELDTLFPPPTGPTPLEMI